ncbi:MAG: hypothetical protein MZV65_54200 [Chromatiales bacterium]|nr:hypothetical protein [Chromatiales bacterium]
MPWRCRLRLPPARTLTIPKKTEFAKGASVPEAVRDECQLPQKVSEFVKEYADKNFDSVKLVDKVSPQTAGSGTHHADRRCAGRRRRRLVRPEIRDG